VTEVAYNCSYPFSNFIDLKYYLAFSLFLLLLLSVLYFLEFVRSIVSDIGFFLIFFGGIYNLNKRMTTGCVEDFLSFFSFFHFNFADIMITIGVILLLLTIWKKK